MNKIKANLICLFFILGCKNTPPEIMLLDHPTDTYDTVGPYKVFALAKDDTTGLSLTTYLKEETSHSFISLPMKQIGENIFWSEISGKRAGSLIEYYLSAQDKGGLEARLPSDAPLSLFSFKILKPEEKCLLDTDCQADEFCQRETNRCRPIPAFCKSNNECRQGYVCEREKGQCILSLKSCFKDADCVIGKLCDLKLNVCVTRPRCYPPTKCPQDFLCEKGAWICLRACNLDEDCPSGEVCEKGRCIQGCVKDEDCSSGFYCHIESGKCIPWGEGLCAPCKKDVECGSAEDLCIDGFCRRRCIKDEDCPRGYICKSTRRELFQCFPKQGECEPVCGKDEFEPNNSFFMAWQIEEGLYNNLRVCGIDDDWFSILLKEGEGLIVKVKFAHHLGDIDLELFDPEETLLDRSLGKKDIEIVEIESVIFEGLYRIRVFSSQKKENIYSLSLEKRK